MIGVYNAKIINTLITDKSKKTPEKTVCVANLLPLFIMIPPKKAIKKPVGFRTKLKSFITINLKKHSNLCKKIKESACIFIILTYKLAHLGGFVNIFDKFLNLQAT